MNRIKANRRPFPQMPTLGSIKPSHITAPFHLVLLHICCALSLYGLAILPVSPSGQSDVQIW